MGVNIIDNMPDDGILYEKDVLFVRNIIDALSYNTNNLLQIDNYNSFIIYLIKSLKELKTLGASKNVTLHFLENLIKKSNFSDCSDDIIEVFSGNSTSIHQIENIGFKFKGSFFPSSSSDYYNTGVNIYAFVFNRSLIYFIDSSAGKLDLFWNSLCHFYE